MAHAIAHMNGRAQMLYVGERPWHGLGTQLTTPPADVAEALRMAGLAGWNVSMVQLHLPGGAPVDCYATVRTLDGAVLGTGHKSNYRVVQNEQALAPFDPFVRAGQATIETAGALKGGAKVWLLAKVNRPDAVIVGKSDDRVAQYILAATSHDGSIAVSFQTTPIRVVCQNTLSAAMGNGKRAMRIRHTASAADTLALVTKTIDAMDADFRKTADMWKALAAKSVTEKQIRAYIDAVFPPAPSKVKTPSDEIAPLDMIELPEVTRATTGGDDLASLLAKPFRGPTTSAMARPTAPVSAQSKPADDGNRRVQDNIIEILERGGRGLDMPGVKGTAWGAYNAVTEYLTWERGRSADNRMHAVWFSDVGARAATAAAETFLR